MTDIIILGIKGMGVDIVDAVEAMASTGSAVRVLGFLDDDVSVRGTEVAGYPVLGSLADAGKFPGACFVNGIGNPTSYQQKPEFVAATGIDDESRWATIIHPRSVVSPRASVGVGTTVLAMCSIMSDVTVGRHVIVLPTSVISHETVVHDHATIASGVCIAGRCDIGAGAYLGSNCCIRQGVRVGKRALVGMGAVVVADVPDGATVIGNPAKPHGLDTA